MYTLDRKGLGRIATMARPRGGDWLHDEMAALAAAGTDVVVSLLKPDEEVELQVAAETGRDRRRHEVPLPTDSRPGCSRAGPFRALLAVLVDELRRDQHVVIHCRHGIGRASLVAAGLLLGEGHSPEQAWVIVRVARGLEVPDTAEQRAWLDRQAVLLARVNPVRSRDGGAR